MKTLVAAPEGWGLLLCVAAMAGGACAQVMAENQLPSEHARSGNVIVPLKMLQRIHEDVLGDRLRTEEHRRRITAAQVKLETWHRIGPFRDQPPLLNWMDNTASSDVYQFGVEKDVWENGGAPRWELEYRAESFPATPEAKRRWTAHPEWIDGYLCDLPRGSAPSAGEAQYVYRQIAAEKPVTLELAFTVRAPASDRQMEIENMEWWRRQARFTCWLNGVRILRYDGHDQPPGAMKVELRPGANHFLAKIVNNRHAYGFSFSIAGLHPAPERPGAHEQPWRPFESYRASDLPWLSESRTPSWYVSGKDWREAMYLSAANLAGRAEAKTNAINSSEQAQLWSALQQGFPEAWTRYEIELSRGANGPFWAALGGPGGRAAAEAVLADHYLRGLTALTGWDAPQVLQAIGANPEQPGYGDRIRETYFTASHYREGLMRLRSFRSVPAPMPGIEAAGLDSKGRIVTRMERDLERYPCSPAGLRHRAKVEALGEEIGRVFEAMVRTGEPRVAAVLDLSRRIDRMWTEEIRALPPILFLERPAYHYDALMFTGAGASPAYLRVLEPATQSVRDLFHSPDLRAHDINLSWDARTVFIGGGGRVSEVGVDGRNFRAITTGQSPAEMPGGRLVFFDDTTGISACKATGVRQLLFTINRDGTSRRIASANLNIDTLPQIMEDGRVVFCRWDYGVNKNVFNRHAIWTQHPDGTGLDLFFGNTVIDPFGFYRPRPVPGRPELVAIFGTHHNHNAGLVGLIWQGAGREGGDGSGFQRITHDSASVGDGCPIWAYQDPYPLNEQLFLVAYGGQADRKIALYLLDRYGNKKCIFEPARNLGAFCPQPLMPRTRPHVIPDKATVPDWKAVDVERQLLTDPDWSQKGTLLVQDVYAGISPEVARGRVKYLAVMEQVVHATPRGGAMSVGAAFYVNRLIGLVPVADDGSAHFEVPALRSLYFHVLDKEGRMLMTMGSDMHVMPGEARGCIGCHEQQKGVQASPPDFRPALATHRAAVRPSMPEWGTHGILEYEAVVQPVFDKYCVKCHSGIRPDAGLDLSGDRTTVFNMSYLTLVEKGLVHFVPGAGHTHAAPTLDYDGQAPLSRGTLRSRLTPYLEDPKRCGVDLPWEDRYRVYAWIDANVPFYSHYKQLSPTILADESRKRLEEVYRRRCASCHETRPRPDAINWLSPMHIWTHVPPSPGQWGIAESGMRARHFNLTTPAASRALQAPLAKEAGGLGLCVNTEGKPVFANPNDPDRRLMLDALASGIVVREQPGVRELFFRHDIGLSGR